MMLVVAKCVQRNDKKRAQVQKALQELQRQRDVTAIACTGGCLHLDGVIAANSDVLIFSMPQETMSGLLELGSLVETAYEDALFQLLSAVQHLQGLGITHGNIGPTCILISYIGTSLRARLGGFYGATTDAYNHFTDMRGCADTAQQMRGQCVCVLSDSWSWQDFAAYETGLSWRVDLFVHAVVSLGQYEAEQRLCPTATLIIDLIFRPRHNAGRVYKCKPGLLEKLRGPENTVSPFSLMDCRPGQLAEYARKAGLDDMNKGTCLSSTGLQLGQLRGRSSLWR